VHYHPDTPHHRGCLRTNKLCQLRWGSIYHTVRVWSIVVTLQKARSPSPDKGTRNFVTFNFWKISYASSFLFFLFDRKFHFVYFILQVSIILPIIFFIICAFLVTLPCYVSPWEVGIGIIIILSGIPVYCIFIDEKTKPAWLINVSCKYRQTLEACLKWSCKIVTLMLTFMQ